MRSPLDWLYKGCGALAAMFLVAVGVLICLSIVARLSAWSIPGLANYAGYCMAASSFLALAYTFGANGHIRIALLLHFLKGPMRRVAEVWCLAIGGGLAAYFAWYSVKMVKVSMLINDVSQGPDATPLWIPQIGMAAGTIVLAIAIFDRLIQVLRGADLSDNALGEGMD